MNEPGAACWDDRRRARLRAEGTLNGIDHVEAESQSIEDGGVQTVQHELHVYLLTKLPPPEDRPWLRQADVVIEGDSDAPPVTVVEVREEPAEDDERDDKVVLVLDREGGASPYVLRLVGDVRNLDPRYAAASFRFLPDTPSELDCLVEEHCPVEPVAVPDLDHLAKDYAGFRQLLLDRLAVTLPDWRDQHTPDLLLSLVELLAYRADHLSYAQDAVATEAYLDTARLRTSVRRHARLVDYRMHEGCNARAWVTVEVEGTLSVHADDIQFLTRPVGVPPGTSVLLPGDLPDDADAGRRDQVVFEPLPEPGRQDVSERDLVHPRELCDRLLHGADEAPAGIRAALPEAVRASLQSAADDGDLPRLIGALTDALNRLLDDPRLALTGGGAARAAHRYGTPNALRGPALRRQNRVNLQRLFGDELLGPAHYHFTQAHNEIHFYTWHQAECCLPRGSTAATLRDWWKTGENPRRGLESLRPGDVLVVEELRSPRTGLAADADPAHRHAVRLTEVRPAVDPLGEVPVVEIAWDPDDALPFALTLSAVGPAPACALLEDLCVARGNVVLVDHGTTVHGSDEVSLQDGARTIPAVPFEPPDDVVPAQDVRWCCLADGQLAEAPPRADHYAPRLAGRPLVHAEPLPPRPPAASRALEQDPRRALPQVWLFSPLERRRPWSDVLLGPAVCGRETLFERWRPRPDLLSSDADDRHVVVEVDDDGTAHLRFGDGELGARPAPDTRFLAWYRVGGGPAGNVEAEAINTLLLHEPLSCKDRIRRVRNPLPARGGTAPEPVATVRLLAPHAFRTVLRRAITPQDYADVVLRDFPDRVQRTAGRLKDAAGARSRVLVLIDPLGSTAPDPALLDAVAGHLRQYRRIGHDVEVRQAEYVYVHLSLVVTVAAHHRAGAVLGALRERFGAGIRSDGGLGFFHPDALSFGQPVAVSAIVAAALHVPGVERVQVEKLAMATPARSGRTPRATDEGTANLLTVKPWQVVRLDDDPDRPQHGILTITTEAAS